MIHRPARILFVFLACFAGHLARGAEGLAFARIWPQWHDAESFDRISEYFTEKENTGGRTVVRTHPDQRAGYYFLVRVDNSAAAIEGAKFVVDVIAPDSADPKTFSFPAAIPTGGGAFNLGLTGADWTNKRLRPVAWKLSLVGSDGKVLLEKQSFLWAKPTP